MIRSMVVAMARNRVIGRDGALPWRLPRDLRHFKRLTVGHAIIMGRRTFESIGHPLPDRRSVVITRNREWNRSGVMVVHSLEDAWRAAAGSDEAFVIGGGELYRAALNEVERIYLTLVEADVDGDTTFPEILEARWRLAGDEPWPADERNPFSCRFQRYEVR